jgi:hypothetical protein
MNLYILNLSIFLSPKILYKIEFLTRIYNNLTIKSV